MWLKIKRQVNKLDYNIFSWNISWQIIPLWSLGPNPTRIATKMILSLSSEPQARSLYRPRIKQKEMNPSEWREWVLIYVCERWEVKCLGLHIMGHAPTVRSTTQAMSYIRTPEGVAQYLGTEPKPRGSRSPEIPKHGASHWRHTIINYLKNFKHVLLLALTIFNCFK